METLNYLIEEGESIRKGIQPIKSTPPIFIPYLAYTLQDNKKYDNWKKDVLAYLKKEFPDDNRINEFNDAIASFENESKYPKYFDSALDVIKRLAENKEK